MILYLIKYYLESKLFSILSERKIKKIHLRRFRKIFEWAREHSEFYRKLYSEAGVLGLQVKTLEDIEKIPNVTKEMILEHDIRSVLTCSAKEKMVVTSSSGSTGKPFDVYWNKKEHFTSYVRTYLALKRYSPFNKFVFIGLYEHKERIEKKSFLYYSQKYLGLFRREKYSVLTPFNEIVESLKDRKIGILSSTSSCFSLLVEELKRSGNKLAVKYAVVSGETLFDDLRNELQTYLQAEVIDVYGCTKLPSMAWSKSDNYVYDYAINSVMPEYIKPVELNGEVYGELLITNFVNKSMPFIRYRIGDYVKLNDSHKKIGKINGRADDIMILNSGRKIFM